MRHDKYIYIDFWQDILTPNNCSPSNTTTVTNGATLTLESGNVIRLLPGFSVQPGSFLNARAVDYSSSQSPCFGNPGGRVSGDRDNAEEKNEELITVDIYPNPSNGLFTLDAKLSQEAGSIMISVISVNGVEVYRQIFSDVMEISEKIDMTNNLSGIYLVRISNGDKILYRRIIKI